MKKGLVVIGILLFISFSSYVYVEAGTSYGNYSTTVGRMNGSGYTNYQTKQVAGQKADVKSVKTGGYNMNVRTQSAGSNGGWSIEFKNVATLHLSNGHNKGTKTRLQFSNKLFTPVNTQATGSWRSN